MCNVKCKCPFPQKVHILIVPTEACNLRCLHCYNAKTLYNSKIMSLKTLNNILNKSAPFYDQIHIIWHGGEPLCAGYDFFENAYQLFSTYTEKFGVDFSFSLQTNGTLLTEDYIDLFVKTKTSISISFDGQYNNLIRQESKDVEDAMRLLDEKSIDYTCLSTISSGSIGHLIEEYEYFKSRGISVKFNPIYLDGAALEHLDCVVSKELWTAKFIELFDYWFYDKQCNINLISCTNLLKRFFGNIENGCLNNACMFRYVAVDPWGNLYPCGRLIEEKFILANISNLTDIREIYASKGYLELLDCSDVRLKECKKCKWFSRCHSGCLASAYLSKGIEQPDTFDCYFNSRMFSHIEKLIAGAEINNINRYARKIIMQST